MGSTSSKAAKTAAGAAKRQYPTRIPPNTGPLTATAPPKGSTVYPKLHASSVRDETINRDAADPDFTRSAPDPGFAASLRSLGAVQAKPFYSHTSTFNPEQGSGDPPQPHMYPSRTTNPAIQVIDARTRLSEAAELEFSQMGKRGFQGKEFLDVVLICQALMLRDDKGLGDKEVEKRLELKSGTMARLGRKGIVGDVAMGNEYRG
ncbi:hypothetical protein MMC30_001106 [Trapelia coarctata]|nr:hypothetical protein [Trapelia coarctata]